MCNEEHNMKGMRRDGPKDREVTAVGFEPTPFRTGALSQRLRPLGQTVSGSRCSPQRLHAGTPSQRYPSPPELDTEK